jgi:3-phenylpropionate/cinnamic acid dioxygenase small subunit
MTIVAPEEEKRLAEFVCHEARLLDEKRFEEWYELFTDDARYWMPLARGQTQRDDHASLYDEDKLLLRIRIERLANPHSFSQQQPSFSQHVLQQPRLERVIDGEHVMRTAFLYVEAQLDDQLFLTGIAWHYLRVEQDRIRIRLKKIELLNCDAALPSIQLFL